MKPEREYQWVSGLNSVGTVQHASRTFHEESTVTNVFDSEKRARDDVRYWQTRGVQSVYVTRTVPSWIIMQVPENGREGDERARAARTAAVNALAKVTTDAGMELPR